MEKVLMRKLGTEKVKVLDKNFDSLYERYSEKAKAQGCLGELKFIKEHSMVLIYVII